MIMMGISITSPISISPNADHWLHGHTTVYPHYESLYSRKCHLLGTRFGRPQTANHKPTEPILSNRELTQSSRGQTSEHELGDRNLKAQTLNQP